MEHGRVDDESLPDFYDAMQKARFLFGNDVQSYLTDIRERAFSLRMAHACLSDAVEKPDRAKYAASKSEELRWLGAQLTELHKRFEKCMSFAQKY